MTRLSSAALPALPAGVGPRVDPGRLGVGIVHLGLGAFHRAHQAVLTEDAVAAAGGDWGICGVTQRSGTVRRQLAPQDGLYGLLERGDGGCDVRVVGALREIVDGSSDPGTVVGRIAAPEVCSTRPAATAASKALPPASRTAI
ncbi:mannitol dehydrogenase family protein, partial [Acidimicrobiaceae bacterium USS-CC1]|nr:mannitol dehydrogenase family protein [Acidiferrimicrobium australe]